MEEYRTFLTSGRSALVWGSTFFFASGGFAFIWRSTFLTSGRFALFCCELVVVGPQVPCILSKEPKGGVGSMLIPSAEGKKIKSAKLFHFPGPERTNTLLRYLFEPVPSLNFWYSV